MRLKEVKGLPVIDPVAARKVGTVADYHVDPSTGRLAALDLKPAEGEPERIAGHQVRRIGQHAVILRRNAASTSPLYGSDTAWLSGARLSNLEVMGDDGNKIGRLYDAAFDQDTLEIDAYLLRTGPISGHFNQHARIKPGIVSSCSPDLMLVRTKGGSKAAAMDEETETDLPAEILTLQPPVTSAALPAATTRLAS